MSYVSNQKGNVMMYGGLVFSLIGIVFYDPLGFLFQGMGLVIIATGLGFMFASYIYLRESESQKINKIVENFEKNRER